MLKPARETIARFIKLLALVGAVELRIFHGGRCYGGVYNDMQRLVDDAARASEAGAEGVYWLHPVSLEPTNTLRSYGKGDAAKNDDVTRRHVFIVDVDSCRPKTCLPNGEEVSSNATEEEKARAFDRAQAVRAFLTERGFPEPLIVDSGNGYHLIYLIDLPAESRLTRDLLYMLAERFSDDEVDIDRSVHNAGRIWKLPGTVVRKGPHSAERPHRVSCIVSEPEGGMRLVTKQAIEALFGVVHAENQMRGGYSSVEEEVRHVLSHIKGRPAYMKWLKISHGVVEKVGNVDTAIALLMERWPEEVRGEYEQKLKHDTPLDRITFGTVVYYAMQEGYKPPRKVHSFHSFQSNGRVEAKPTPQWEPFPVEALPRAAGDYAEASADAIGCDVAFVAVPVLAVLAAAVGNSHRVQLKRSWEESSALWAVTIADSGSAKSPALDAPLRPIYALEREAHEEYQAERERYEQELEYWQGQKKNERGEKPVPPKRNRYRVADTTVESLVLVHQENLRSLIVARDELAGFFGSFDRYSSGEADAQSYIEMHGGRPVVVDRKSSDPPVLRISSPNVSIVGTTQPGVLRERFTDQLFAAGLPARFLMTMPPPRPRQWTDDDVPLEVFNEYTMLVRGLYALPYNEEDGHVSLPLSPGAKSLFKAFFNENGALLGSMLGGALRSALAKIEAVAARLALILHLAEGESGPISEDAMHRAIILAKWFRHETRRIYQLLGFEERGMSSDERLVKNLPTTFTTQDIEDAAKVRSSQAYNILNRLLNQGLVAPAEGRGNYRVSSDWKVERVERVENELTDTPSNSSHSTYSNVQSNETENLEQAGLDDFMSAWGDEWGSLCWSYWTEWGTSLVTDGHLSQQRALRLRDWITEGPSGPHAPELIDELCALAPSRHHAAVA